MQILKRVIACAAGKEPAQANLLALQVNRTMFKCLKRADWSLVEQFSLPSAASANKLEEEDTKSGIDITNKQALVVQIYMQHPGCFLTPLTDTFFSESDQDDDNDSE